MIINMEDQLTESVSVNPYDRMSLLEACAQVVADVNALGHDFEMNVMLKEHAYLLKNKQEIVYEAEGYLTEAGKDFFEGFKKFVLGVIEKIKKFFASIRVKIASAIDNVRTKLSTIGVSKEKFLKVLVPAYNTMPEEDKPFAVPNVHFARGKEANKSTMLESLGDTAAREFEKCSKTGKANIEELNARFYGDAEAEETKADTKATTNIVPSQYDINMAAEVVFNPRSSAGAIKDSELKAIAQIKKEAKEAKSSEAAADAKAKISAVTATASALMKIYVSYINDNLAIVKGIIKKTSALGRGERKVAAAAKQAGEKAAKGVDTAKEKVNDAAEKIGNTKAGYAVYGAAINAADAAKKAETYFGAKAAEAKEKVSDAENVVVDFLKKVKASTIDEIDKAVKGRLAMINDKKQRKAVKSAYDEFMKNYLA